MAYGFDDSKNKNEVLGIAYKGDCGKSGETRDTGISVNAQDGGKTYLIAYSFNTSNGDNTGSGISMLRCGFDGNNYEITSIASSKGEGNIGLTFGISENGTLTYQNSSAGMSRVSIYSLT